MFEQSESATCDTVVNMVIVLLMTLIVLSVARNNRNLGIEPIAYPTRVGELNLESNQHPSSVRTTPAPWPLLSHGYAIKEVNPY